MCVLMVNVSLATVESKTSMLSGYEYRVSFNERSCYSYGAVKVNQLAILTVNDIHSAGNPCDIRG